MMAHVGEDVEEGSHSSIAGRTETRMNPIEVSVMVPLEDKNLFTSSSCNTLSHIF